MNTEEKKGGASEREDALNDTHSPLNLMSYLFSKKNSNLKHGLSTDL